MAWSKSGHSCPSCTKRCLKWSRGSCDHTGNLHTCLLLSCSIYLTDSTANTAPGAAIFDIACSLSIRCTCRWPMVMAENMPAYLVRLSSSFLMSPVRKWNLTRLHLFCTVASSAAGWICSCATLCKIATDTSINESAHQSLVGNVLPLPMTRYTGYVTHMCQVLSIVHIATLSCPLSLPVHITCNKAVHEMSHSQGMCAKAKETVCMHTSQVTIGHCLEFMSADLRC